VSIFHFVLQHGYNSSCLWESLALKYTYTRRRVSDQAARFSGPATSGVQSVKLPPRSPNLPLPARGRAAQAARYFAISKLSSGHAQVAGNRITCSLLTYLSERLVWPEMRRCGGSAIAPPHKP
jgi:hypothetical protein